MRIEWATACSTISITEDEGVTVSGIGRNGYIFEPGTLVRMQAPILLCFIVEDGDEPGATCQIWHRVIGPDGEPHTPVHTTTAEWAPGTAPRLVSPERYYASIRVDFDVADDGMWVIVVWDAFQTVQLPFRLSALSSL